jgi:hypothetical protein
VWLPPEGYASLLRIGCVASLVATEARRGKELLWQQVVTKRTDDPSPYPRAKIAAAHAIIRINNSVLD